MREQRRYERVAFFRELTVTPLPHGKPVPAHSFDISIGGVGLYAEASLERGDLVQIGFRWKDAHQQELVESVTGRIAYCRADEDGNRLGVEFLQPLEASTNPLLTQTIESL